MNGPIATPVIESFQIIIFCGLIFGIWSKQNKLRNYSTYRPGKQNFFYRVLYQGRRNRGAAYRAKGGWGPQIWEQMLVACSRHFMVWKINSGLVWAAGPYLWKKSLGPIMSNFWGRFFSCFCGIFFFFFWLRARSEAVLVKCFLFLFLFF